MNDTPLEIRKLQIEYFLTKTPLERLQMAEEQCESVRKIIENTIFKENKDISKADLKVKVFERYYKKDFSEEQLKEVSKSIHNYYK